MPGEIRDLIEGTYICREEQGNMKRWLYCHSKGRDTLQRLARLGLAEWGNTLPECKAQTRYSEQDSYEVLILRNISPGREHATLTLLGGEKVELPLQRHKLNKAEWRRRTAMLMRQIVNVPSGEKPRSVPVDTLKRFGLQHCFFLGSPDWPDDESLLRVAMVDDTDRLRGIENTQVHDKYILEYREDLGYRAISH